MRSVIGHVVTEHYAARVMPRSAGTQPGDHIHPEVAEALDMLGLAPSPNAPHEREDRCEAKWPSLSVGEEYPYVSGVKYVDRPVDDSGGQNERTTTTGSADPVATTRALR